MDRYPDYPCDSLPGGGERKIKMILDVDTGIDDALALAYVAGHPAVELLGVTVSYGNVVLEQALENTLRLLSLLGREDVPVFAGAAHPSYSDKIYQPDEIVKVIHGINGVGEVQLPETSHLAEQETAADFMIRMADLYRDELTIVAVGPLTTLAQAMEQDAGLEKKVGKIVIMGGALTVPGNKSPLAEANIYNDPFAARRVLKSKAKVTMVGLDATCRSSITKKETSKWRALQNPASLAYAEMADHCIQACEFYEPEHEGFALHDPLAVAVAIDPTIVKTFDLFMEVGTGKEDFGRTVGDKNRLLDEHPNVSVCLDVDHSKFPQCLFDVLYHTLAR